MDSRMDYEWITNGLEFSSLPLQSKVLSRETKVIKYLPEVKPAEKS
jgi:hypothetical protein